MVLISELYVLDLGFGNLDLHPVVVCLCQPVQFESTHIFNPDLYEVTGTFDF